MQRGRFHFHQPVRRDYQVVRHSLTPQLWYKPQAHGQSCVNTRTVARPEANASFAQNRRNRYSMVVARFSPSAIAIRNTIKSGHRARTVAAKSNNASMLRAVPLDCSMRIIVLFQPPWQATTGVIGVREIGQHRICPAMAATGHPANEAA